MKVAKLTKGDLISPAGDSEYFAIYNATSYYAEKKEMIPWLHVRVKPRNKANAWHRVDIRDSRIAVYLGTKEDVKVEAKWCNRFVLLDGQVYGVDPAAWKRIKLANS